MMQVGLAFGLALFLDRSSQCADNPLMGLVLRRANIFRKGGPWQQEDYDVFDGEQNVGRIYCVNAYAGKESWFWGVSFQLTGRKSYGDAPTLDAAKAAFKAEYERWQRERRRKKSSS
jgi:hypothetical protein